LIDVRLDCRMMNPACERGGSLIFVRLRAKIDF
jgi:hypothetical protein